MSKKILSHPFEAETDRMIVDLKGDLRKIKINFDTGASYNFVFDEIHCYVALPTYAPARNENLMRIEFIIGEVSVSDVPQILFKASLDFDMNCHCFLRLVPRTKDGSTYEMVLQAVANVDLVQSGFVASAILYGLELAQEYRQQLFTGEERAVQK